MAEIRIVIHHSTVETEMPKSPDHKNRDSDAASDEIDLGEGLSPEEAATIEDHFANGDLPESIGSFDLPEEVATLIAALERERDEAIEARKRALADYVNFQKRASENEARARKEGTLSVLRSLLPVLDHFELALNQDPATTSTEQLLGGVRIVKDELMKVLETCGVAKIVPKVGDEFDPIRHEAMMRQVAEGVLPNHVVAVFQPGFASGDRVIRPAKVAVAPEA